jgi:1-deoxy-D-xylulose 5-phosphate reductoisomerase
VEYYLKNKIDFQQIPMIIKKIVDDHRVVERPNLEEILSAIERIKEETRKLIERKHF